MKKKEYRKIMLGGRELAVISVTIKEVDGEIIESIPSFAKKFLKKENCEFVAAGPDDFLAYYERTYGKMVPIDL